MRSIRSAMRRVCLSRLGFGAFAMARRSVSLGGMLPAEFYQPIGHLVAVWSKLETEIDNLLDDLHRAPSVAALGPIPPSFAARAKMLKQAERRAFHSGQDRNLIVHGPTICFSTTPALEQRLLSGETYSQVSTLAA